MAEFSYGNTQRSAADFELDYVTRMLGDDAFSEAVIIAVVKPELLCIVYRRCYFLRLLVLYLIGVVPYFFEKALVK